MRFHVKLNKLVKELNRCFIQMKQLEQMDCFRHFKGLPKYYNIFSKKGGFWFRCVCNFDYFEKKDLKIEEPDEDIFVAGY